LEEVEDLSRLWQLDKLLLDGVRKLLFEDLVAQPNALVTDVHGRARDQLPHLLLRLAAEGALQQIARVGGSCHDASLKVVFPEYPAGLTRTRRRAVFGAR